MGQRRVHGALSEALCTMEVFLSLLLLSGWMAQETFCKCLKNKTEISTEPSEGTGLPPSDCTSEGKQIISLLNAYRAENGLPPIQKSCALCTVANEKAVSGNGHSWTGQFACTYDANNFDCCGRNPLSSQGTRAMAMRTGLEQQMQMLLSMDGSRAGRTTT